MNNENNPRKSFRCRPAAIGVDCTTFTTPPAERPAPSRCRPRKPDTAPAELGETDVSGESGEGKKPRKGKGKK